MRGRQSLVWGCGSLHGLPETLTRKPRGGPRWRPCDRGQGARPGFVGAGDGLVFPGNCVRSNGVPPRSYGETLVPVTQTVGSLSGKVIADAVRGAGVPLEGAGQLFHFDCVLTETGKFGHGRARREHVTY